MHRNSRVTEMTNTIAYHIRLLITDRPQLQHRSKMYTAIEQLEFCFRNNNRLEFMILCFELKGINRNSD